MRRVVLVLSLVLVRWHGVVLMRVGSRDGALQLPVIGVRSQVGLVLERWMVLVLVGHLHRKRLLRALVGRRLLLCLLHRRSRCFLLLLLLLLLTGRRSCCWSLGGDGLRVR